MSGRRTLADWRAIFADHPTATGAEIARMLGVSDAAVSMARKRCDSGLQHDRAPARAKAQWLEIFAGHPDLSVTEIAQKFGVSRPAVSAARKRYGVDLRDARCVTRSTGTWRDTFAAHPDLTNAEIAALTGAKLCTVRSARSRCGGVSPSPLTKLTAAQRADYDVLMRAKYRRAEALAAVGAG